MFNINLKSNDEKIVLQLKLRENQFLHQKSFITRSELELFSYGNDFKYCAWELTPLIQDHHRVQ